MMQRQEKINIGRLVGSMVKEIEEGNKCIFISSNKEEGYVSIMGNITEKQEIMNVIVDTVDIFDIKELSSLISSVKQVLANRTNEPGFLKSEGGGFSPPHTN